MSDVDGSVVHASDSVGADEDWQIVQIGGDGSPIITAAAPDHEPAPDLAPEPGPDPDPETGSSVDHEHEPSPEPELNSEQEPSPEQEREPGPQQDPGPVPVPVPVPVQDTGTDPEPASTVVPSPAIPPPDEEPRSADPPPAAAAPQAQTIGNRARVLYDFVSIAYNELDVLAGDQVTILSKEGSGWWLARDSERKLGWLPARYVEELPDEEQDHDDEPGSRGECVTELESDRRNEFRIPWIAVTIAMRPVKMPELD